jgi:folylpolyglutamate synthase/dihydropteroate synthase
MLRQVPEGVAACVVESQTVAWERLLAEDTGGPNLCCGSLYLVGYCLRFLEGEPK